MDGRGQAPHRLMPLPAGWPVTRARPEGPSSRMLRKLLLPAVTRRTVAHGIREPAAPHHTGSTTRLTIWRAFKVASSRGGTATEDASTRLLALPCPAPARIMPQARRLLIWCHCQRPAHVGMPQADARVGLRRWLVARSIIAGMAPP